VARRAWVSQNRVSARSSLSSVWGSALRQVESQSRRRGLPREPFPEIPSGSRGTSTLEESVPETKPEYPLVTIVVPTAGVRPDLLTRCVKSLTALRYPAYEIVVVDNRSQSMFDGGTEIWSESWIEESDSASTVRVVREARPGASYARNTGIAAAHGDIVAFTDDDVEVDANWLSGIVDAFNSSPEVKCVTGLVIAAELETEAQVLFELFSGGFDRGLVPHSWSMPSRKSPNRNFLKRSTFLVTESLSPEQSLAQSLYVVIGTCGVGRTWRFGAISPFEAPTTLRLAPEASHKVERKVVSTRMYSGPVS